MPEPEFTEECEASGNLTINSIIFENDFNTLSNHFNSRFAIAHCVFESPYK